jgi:dimethylargininase
MFSKAIVRQPGANYADGLTTARLGAPDYELALSQHALYCEALEQCGLKLSRLDADEEYPDSTFVEDTAVIIGTVPGVSSSACWAYDTKAILTRPGSPCRVGEVDRINSVLSQFCTELHSIHEPGTLDGGDICEAEDHFFIGVSQRTNESGAQQLAGLLRSYGYTSSFVDVRGVKSILHLKSGLAYLGDNRLVAIDALANRKEFQRYELVLVTTGEEYAANCIRVNDCVLLAAGFPQFEQALRDLGYTTKALAMTEFQKMDGGLSCLSLRF